MLKGFKGVCCYEIVVVKICCLSINIQLFWLFNSLLDYCSKIYDEQFFFLFT